MLHSSFSSCALGEGNTEVFEWQWHCYQQPGNNSFITGECLENSKYLTCRLDTSV